MLFQAFQAAAPLRPYVIGHWVVDDLKSEWADRMIRNGPFAGALLVFNFGQSTLIDGTAVPGSALLGVRTRAGTWQTVPETYVVMTVLSVCGVARLFPASGPATAETAVDLADLTGDRTARMAHAALSAAWEPRRIAACLDRWLLRRLETVVAPLEIERLGAAHERLRSGVRVEDAASQVGVSQRQLRRWFRAHLGVGPKDVMDLERLQQSLRVMRAGNGMPYAGYSDQAHQIRIWRRRLGMTPAGYHKACDPSREQWTQTLEVDARAPQVLLSSVPIDGSHQGVRPRVVHEAG